MSIVGDGMVKGCSTLATGAGGLPGVFIGGAGRGAGFAAQPKTSCHLADRHRSCWPARTFIMIRAIAGLKSSPRFASGAI